MILLLIIRWCEAGIYFYTDAAACLAVPLAFQTGLRLREIVALKKNDIEGNYIYVYRMEVRKVRPLDNGTGSSPTKNKSG